MASAFVDRADHWAGTRLESAVRAHHHRRLRRIGQLGQLHPPGDGCLWAAGDPAPRSGCALDVMVDGANALPRIAAAISGARTRVSIAGWYLSPDFRLARDGATPPLRDLLAEVAEEV